jgi:fructokinase
MKGEMPTAGPDSRGRRTDRGVAVLGEVLFDRFPDGPRLGGAPFNVAWHLAGFGLAPDFVSRVGADPLGAEIRRAMTGHGMATGLLQDDREHPTGQVKVTLDGRGGHAFEILQDQAYDHIDGAPVVARLGAHPPAAACFGTLCLRGPVSRAAILSALAVCPGTRFLDVNLRDGCWTEATVRAALEAATVAKVNDDELAVLTGRLLPDSTAPASVEARAAGLRAAFDLDAVCVTRGPEGALWHGRDADAVDVATPPTEVVDTVGAGDAFSSVAILGLVSGWAPALFLKRAAAFASAICGLRGACPEDPAFYAPFRAEWGLQPVTGA